jgi:hypothetical protein
VEVRGLVWLGVRTSQFQETARFYRDVLGLSAFQEDATSLRLRLPNRTEIHVHGPADEGHGAATSRARPWTAPPPSAGGCAGHTAL